jgi:hypothetical protein
MNLPKTSRMGWLLSGLALFAVPLLAVADPKDDKKKRYPTPLSGAGVSVMPAAWQKAQIKPLSAAELDALLHHHQQAEQLTPSPRTTDEQFLRRVMLDLIGRLPTAQELQDFVADPASDKRPQLIDRLLASEEFARHWARGWRAIVSALIAEVRIKSTEKQFEDWLFQQLTAGQNWAQITRGIVAAKGDLLAPRGPNTPKPSEEVEVHPNGATYFLLSHTGNDAVTDRAAATSRIFLGIQIQCAQCHDHPSDIWKQEQFHQFAAFFARTKEQQVRDPAAKQPVAVRLASLPRGEHQMTDTRDPNKKTVTHPKFITGEGLPPGRSDEERRKALADFITHPSNYWFAAAFVNRTWAELMGQGFYQPVDNLGPLQEATYPDVLLALAAHFRATDYDIRGLYRLILNSEAYQRQVRLGEATDTHLRFTANYPSRLKPEDLWAALVQVLEGTEQTGKGRGQRAPGKAPANPARLNIERLFISTFFFDPSASPDNVEGTIPQALMLMNNRAIQERIRATGQTMLADLLRQTAQDEEALRLLYVRVLARKPTAAEVEACLEHLKQSKNRAEGFEDILWCLLNSAEFATRR